MIREQTIYMKRNAKVLRKSDRAIVTVARCVGFFPHRGHKHSVPLYAVQLDTGATGYAFADECVEIS